MKKIAVSLIVLLGIPSSLLVAMDDPNGGNRPNRPSGSGRPPRPPRPQAVYGAQPLILNPQNQPVAPVAAPAPAPVYGPAPMNPMHIITTQPAAQPTVTNPMHIITTTPPAIVTPQLQPMSDKERARLDKINHDLDKIEEALKDMGWDFGGAALSAAGFDPIGTVGGVGMGMYRLGKINVLLIRVMYTSQKLSNGSPRAKAARDALLPRISKINNAVEKIKSIFSSAKEAK